MLNLEELNEKYEDDFLKFERIEPKPYIRSPDLVAFNLLYSLCPPERGDIVVSAEHDQFWLGIDTEKFAEVATEEQFLTLVRCGIMYDEDTESFSMFV